MPDACQPNQMIEEESSCRTIRSSLARFRLWSCLFLLASVYLMPSCKPAFCQDQRAERPLRGTSNAQSTTPSVEKRRVTVGDAIQMTRLGDTSYENGTPSNGIVAKFSPDGKRFVVILRKGNLEANTNEYSMVLFQTAEVFHSPTPRLLISLASSSNRPAIDNVLWLDDNDTILFLGERPDESTQLYSLKCSSQELAKVTSHATNLTSFVATGNGQEIVFAAKRPVSTLLTDSVARTGISVTNQWLPDLIRETQSGTNRDEDSLFIKRLGQGEREIAAQGLISGISRSEMSLSLDGAHLVIQTEATHVSDTWKEYEDQFLRIHTRDLVQNGTPTGIFQYELVDMVTGVSRVLFDAPIPTAGSDLAWSPDSGSVVVSGAYLPLDADDPAELALRKAHTFLAEFKIPGGQFIKISQEDLRLLSWDPKTGYVTCDVGRLDSLNGKTTTKTYFRKNGETWSKASAPDEAATLPPLLDIVLDEGMNSPPHLLAVDSRTGRRSVLMDLNPQFQNLEFARVEEIAWKDSHGNEIKGGLYWPPDYLAGKRYPLILQTHGWNPDRFWMDGPWTTAFAAQALAGRGFIVLQVSDPDWRLWETPKEAPSAMSSYEGAIDYLDRRGLIDRNRVGIIGFSRTYWYVTYTLTHSKHHIAAATLADGIDYGYFQYMAFANQRLSDSFEQVNGAAPVEKGLRKWLRNSPSFLMDKIETPLQIQTLGPTSLLSDWDWYSGLSRLRKPVELIYIPEGTHILEKPWDRIISQQGNVDWFCFWLKGGEEDPDPAKAEQYTHWRELRTLRDRIASRVSTR